MRRPRANILLLLKNDFWNSGQKTDNSFSWLYLYIEGDFFNNMSEWMKVAQSCLTLCDPMDCTIHGSLQATILEWVAIPFSRRCSQPMDQTQVSRIAGGFFTSWATREAVFNRPKS